MTSLQHGQGPPQQNQTQTQLENLLFKATNPANKIEDVNTIKQFCDVVAKSSDGSILATRLLAHKIQSPLDQEALQALAVLEACSRSCGPTFQAEVGKFRFLNELIKVISPKYLGGRTPPHVKQKVVELLFTWTKELPQENKILEAYELLKSQGSIKEDPAYVGEAVFASSLPPRDSGIVDQEQALHLQKLLHSKNPEDIQKANIIIKGMVRKDEEKMEKLTRQSSQLQAVANNIKLLSEMLDNFSSSSSPEERELMSELCSACEKMRPGLFRIASETEDQDETIGEILVASDDLTRVIDRYRSVVVQGLPDQARYKLQPAQSKSSKPSSDLLELSQAHVKSVDHDFVDILGPDTSNDGLLPLGVLETSHNALLPVDSFDNSLLEQDMNFSTLGSLGLVRQDILTHSPVQEHPQIDLLCDLQTAPGGIQTDPSERALCDLQTVSSEGALCDIQTAPSEGALCDIQTAPSDAPNTNNSVALLSLDCLSVSSPTMSCSSDPPSSTSRAVAMDQLDHLGESILKQHLTGNVTASFDTKRQMKLPMSVLIQQKTASPDLIQQKKESPDIDSGVVGVSPLTGLDKQLEIEKDCQTETKTEMSAETSQTNENKQSVEMEKTKEKPKNPDLKIKDLNIPLISIKPNTDLKPLTLQGDPGGISIVLHFTRNKPSEGINVVVVTITNNSEQEVQELEFKAVVQKGCKVKLQAPSSSNLPAFNPFSPAPAVTQVMILGNPLQSEISLNYFLSYSVDGETVTEMGQNHALPKL